MPRTNKVDRMNFRALVSVLILLSVIPAFADEPIVAKVNNAVITSRDLNAEVDRLIPLTTYHKSVSEEKRNTFMEKALQNLIDRELQYQDAVAKAMKPDSKQVKTQMSEIRDRFSSKKEYRTALDRAGITEDQLRSQVEKNVVVLAVYAKTVTEPSRMSDGELKEYFDKNPAKFRQPEDVKLSLISTKNEKKAGEILAALKDGEDFGRQLPRDEWKYRLCAQGQGASRDRGSCVLAESRREKRPDQGGGYVVHCQGGG